jgi:hypothetical protein
MNYGVNIHFFNRIYNILYKYLYIWSKLNDMERVHKTFVLLENNDVKCTFGNLSKVVKYMIHKEVKFPSYWTLIRVKENPIIYKDYKIFRVTHY